MPRSFLVFIVSLFLHTYLAAQTADRYLPEARPESHGFTTAFLHGVGNAAARQIPSLGALVVWRGNALIYEGYFHHYTRDSAFDVKSVTKSVLCSIIGAARARGMVPNLDTLVLDLLPEYARHYPALPDFAAKEEWQDADSALHLLTFRHLLTMQTGFNYKESGPICQSYSISSDPVKFAMEMSFTEDPGERFNYCSPGAHIAAAMLARMIKEDLYTFADSAVFKPAGIHLRKWPIDAEGRYLGASGMEMTAQDMVRFGALYLKKGKLNGISILPKEWVTESTEQHVVLKKWDVMPGADGYGYYWWRRVSNGHQVYVASGYRGQLICVIPDLDMVIATACTLGDKNRGRSEIRRLHFFIDQIIKEAR